MRSIRTVVTSAAAVALATTGLAAGVATGTADASPRAAATCNNKLFAVDGYHHGQDGHNFGGPALTNLTTAPGWDRELFPYTDGIVPLRDKITLNRAVSKAVPALEAEAIDYHNACPGAKIAFVGYSFGALIAGNAIADLSTKDVIPHRQLNAVLYGDPRRAPQNKGVEGPAGGVLTMLPNLPTIDAPGPRNFHDVDVSEVCHENDVICNAANPFTNSAAVLNELVGYATGDHGYGKFDPFGDYSHPVDHYIPQTQRTLYGPPLPLAIGTPHDMLSNNPGWNAAVKAIGDAIDSVTLGSLLQKYNLPGKLADPLMGLVAETGSKA